MGSRKCDAAKRSVVDSVYVLIVMLLQEVGPSRHFTMVFNTFVWLQIFNMINARKINNELNVFQKAFSNPLWLIIMAVISVGQALLTTFGGHALKCHLGGLTGTQWGISMALALGSLIVQLLIHFIPAEKIKYIPQAGMKESDLFTAPASLALLSRGRLDIRVYIVR